MAATASRTRDTANTVLDFGLSQRALLAASARTGDVAELISGRLAALAGGSAGVDSDVERAVVRQAVHEVRTTPAPRPLPPAPAAC